MTSQPIICLAHGSRHPRADAAVADIATEVARLSGREAFASYLDFSPLTPTTVAGLLAAAGHRGAVVVPLLFTRAFHMGQDVPEALAGATAETGVTLHQADGIGTGADLAALLASRISSRDPGADEVVLYSVGSSVPGANGTVAELAADVGRRLGVPGHALVATGPGGRTGPDALAAHVEASTAERIAVEPVFVSPGTLWDLAVRRLAGVTASVSTGTPLTTDIAPLVVERALACEQAGDR